MNIIQVPSPNFTAGRKTYHPEAIVIHIMDGTFAGTDSWFGSTKSKVSAHYGIGQDGTVHQFVDEQNTAWHAGRVNAPSWSLIKRLSDGSYINPNFYTIGIEHEGKPDSDWTDQMYDSSSSMIAKIATTYGIPLDRQHIIGHHEIFSIKTCPGTKVDINKLIDMSRQKAGYVADPQIIYQDGTVVVTDNLNIRSGTPSRAGAIVRKAIANEKLRFAAYTNNGEASDGIAKWYQTSDRLWFWSGAVKHVDVLG